MTVKIYLAIRSACSGLKDWVSPNCFYTLIFQGINMKITAVFLSLFFIFGLAACNTIEGAGKDVEAAGSAVEESAKENKNY